MNAAILIQMSFFFLRKRQLIYLKELRFVTVSYKKCTLPSKIKHISSRCAKVVRMKTRELLSIFPHPSGEEREEKEKQRRKKKVCWLFKCQGTLHIEKKKKEEGRSAVA